MTDPQPPSGADLALLGSELRLACMRISRRVRFEQGDTLAPHRFSVLARLEHGPATPGELADRERISPPSMTKTLAGLAGDDYVERAADPLDGRRIVVTLTQAGRAALEATRARRDQWMSSRLAGLRPDEIDVLAAAAPVLAKVAAR